MLRNQHSSYRSRWSLVITAIAYSCFFGLLGQDATTTSTTDGGGVVVHAFSMITSSSAAAASSSSSKQHHKRLVGKNNNNKSLNGCSIELIEPTTNTTVILLGCFHGSRSSAIDVEDAILLKRTDDDTNVVDTVVVLELCASRFIDLRKSMNMNIEEKQQKPWIKRYIQMIVTTNELYGLPTAIAAAVLSGFSSIQTSISNLQPGLEFITAINCCKNTNRNNTNIILADQNVDITLQRLGTIPQISYEMWYDLLFNKDKKYNIQQSLFVQQAIALYTALFGYNNNNNSNNNSKTSLLPTPVTLPTFLTRSKTALNDLMRLTLAPVFLLQLMAVSSAAIATPSSNSNDIIVTTSPTTNIFESITTISEAVAIIEPLIVPTIINIFILLITICSIALPATKVVLTERDDILTKGIIQACNTVVSKDNNNQNNKKRVVVAVLGLLHVNGVAQRLLMSSSSSQQKQE